MSLNCKTAKFVNRILFLAIAIGVAQYAFISVSLLSQGAVSLWQVDSSELESGGIARYLKDVFVIAFGLVWPFHVYGSCSTKFRGVVNAYFVFLALLVFCGSVGTVAGYSSILFYQAGIRWVLLLHAVFGVFIYSCQGAELGERGGGFVPFFVLCCLDLIVVALQYKLVNGQYGLRLGEGRVPGLFSNAAVAGYFAVSIALISIFFKKKFFFGKLSIYIVLMLIALASGTRFAMLCIYLIFVFSIVDAKEVRRNRALRRPLSFILSAMAIFVAYFAYDAMTEQVGRGDLLLNQVGDGGRISNFFEVIKLVGESDLLEVMFGHGLGVGTNTVQAMLVASSESASVTRFNVLIDNTIATSFFQLGLVGSIVLWGGVLSFFLFCFRRCRGSELLKFSTGLLVFLLAVFTQNIFEQYFLMMAFGYYFGRVYCLGRSNRVCV